ncbi:glycoside hydrolase family 2 sugar binding [Pedosphaera parvula Ellin514]|uniref:Glycoside hydrolase family 2 sugar binding n=2 Tax=Pedosphaera TaxID=1032526 RepID=B9XBB8_PEDPL|nr:glycoside hydrolase family 2 sugar binding [Pedosphaera parvula Ellin514]
MTMKILLKAVGLTVLFGGLSCDLAQAEWKAAEGPLMTRWGKQVSPQSVLPEYPRPQMVRKEWQNLNGLWDYAIAPMDSAQPEKFDGEILVPFPVESALSGVMKGLDEKSVLWYRRTFEVPRNWQGERVLIHFGAVDWKTTVFVNGRELGTHKGGYDGFSYDVTEALKKDGKQELVVKVYDPTDGNQVRGKQTRTPKGIFYTPTSGIWQTVWLEPVPEVAIEDLKITPDLDAGALKVKVISSSKVADVQVEVVAFENDKEVVRITGALNQEMNLAIKSPKVWTPEQPFLYDLKVRILHGKSAVDEVGSYFGMRKIALQKDEKGINRIALNGKVIFQMGTLDQGFWPDGLYTAPSDEALRYDIEILKKLGFNMTRKHIKVEPERWYYWCDKLGLLVWQDMPSGDNKTPESRTEFESELARMLPGRHNHPCIVTWVVFNEGWGQYDTERLTAWVKKADPTRLVDNASGWTDKNVGDLVDMHKYPGPGCPETETNRAAVLGEFGGLGLAMKGHTWSKESWGYQGMADSKKLTQKYVSLISRAWALKEDAGLCAYVYTQTTDVETECNGLMTYDRAVMKLDAEQALAANKGETKEAQVKVVVPDAQQDKVSWKYTFEQPSADWAKSEFVDTSWKEGRAGFGTKGTPGAIVKTEWKSADIWMRRQFTLKDGKLKNAVLQVHHDEDAEIYINGVLAARLPGFTSDYEDSEISPEAMTAFRSGTNILAVHCHQTSGGQYIDVGILATPVQTTTTAKAP